MTSEPLPSRHDEDGPRHSTKQGRHGNVVVFDFENREIDGLWCGHVFPVVALAVVPSQYIVSTAAAEMATDMILWDLQSPIGTPLHRIEWWNGIKQASAGNFFLRKKMNE